MVPVARAVWLASLAAALPECEGAAAAAVLRLESASGREAKRIPASFADWVDPEASVAAAPLVYSEANSHGCRPQRRCPGCALFVLGGQCSLARKARLAEDAGAELLVVASESTARATGAGTLSRTFSRQPPRIVAAIVSRDAGRQILLAHGGGRPLTASCRRANRIGGDVRSELCVLALATGLVALGAWHSVEDLRHPTAQPRFSEDVVAVEESSGPQFVLAGSVVLTVLFFFMRYLIYVLVLVFAAGAASTTPTLLEPVIAGVCPAMRLTRACRLPAWLAALLGVSEDRTRADVVADGTGWLLGLAFLIWRNDDTFGWVLQDIIVAMLLVTIQRTVRLPNLRVGTTLLACAFFFDIFWVFLSPLIFKKSVMIEVATGGGTGQSVPMVLKIPAVGADFPGQFKLLGLGDIALPGLLISLLLRHDLLRGSPRFSGYFAAGLAGYALGLTATFVSLRVMEHGQPALLFLVPSTLVPSCVIAHCKGELRSLWKACYGPGCPPSGYGPLPSGDDKEA